jgi:hypothetical protein
MAIPGSERSYERRAGLGSPAHPRTLAVLIGGAVAPIGVVLWLVPAPFVLPAFSVLSILMSVLIGAVAYFVDRTSEKEAITNWDIAAAFMLVGCVAGLLCEPHNVLQLVGEANAIR